ncbi:MAG: OmpH family outer membrane protein [Candidatus Korobacteraceae bacterium]
MNRKILSVIVLLVLAVSAWAQQASSPATQPPAASGPAPTRIGIVDIQAVILATNEGRREFEALQKKFEPRQAELQKLSQEIEGLRKQVQDQGSKLTDDVRGGIVRDIENKQKSLQRQAEDAQQDFQQQRDEVAGRILQKLGPVLAEYAKKGNYAVILDASQPWPQGQVVWAAEPADVSREIVEAYNTASGVGAPAANAPSATRPNAPAPKPAAPAPKPPAQ